jgi:transcription antitermination factor NusG
MHDRRIMTTNGTWDAGAQLKKTAVSVAAVRTGTPVKVHHGPFCGAVGSIVERKPNRLALVRIDMDGRSMCVEVDPQHIDVLN